MGTRRLSVAGWEDHEDALKKFGQCGQPAKVPTSWSSVWR